MNTILLPAKDFIKPKSVTSLLRANEALEATKHLLKNIGHYHHNANERLGLKQWQLTVKLPLSDSKS